MAGLTREDMAKSVSVKPKQYYDYTLLFLIIFLVGFGVVMISSISAYNATKYYDDSMLFVKNQIKYGLLGMVAMIGLSFFDYHLVTVRFMKLRLVAWFYLMCVAMQFVVLFIGHSMNGSSRWLDFGGIRFQPSELTKISVILYAAFWVQKVPKLLDHFLGFVFIMAIFAAPIGMVLAENLSTAIILVGIVFVICFVTSRKKMYYYMSVIILAIGGYVAIFKVSYRAARIDNWLNVETADGAYQIRQGMYAIASGGWFGKGLGNSIQKLGYIPEVHTDMIFSCICEELGIFGAICLLAVYVFLLWRIFLIGLHAPDLFGSLIVCGVFVQIALQVLINIAVVTNSMPATGIPLPFVSYGGSSLIFTMMEIGMVLSVAKRIDYGK